MGLLEDVMFNAKAAVNAVGQKAGQIVDVSKLRINAADLNNEISKRFESLGRVVYDARKTENSSQDLIEECIAVIEDLYEQLDDLNEQIAVVKNRIKCKSCGYENVQEAVYCSRCGARLVIEAEPVEPQNEEKDPEEAVPEADAAPSQAENAAEAAGEDHNPEEN